MSTEALAGRTALVTGAGRRLGRRIAERLAEAGAAVVVHYRASRQDAEEVVGRIRGHGGEAWAVPADLGEPGVSALVAHAAEAAGRPLDILVNNASVFPEDDLDSMEYADLDANMRVNAWAPFALTRALAAQTEAGAVVNLLDTRIVDDDPRHVPYLLAKKTLAELTRLTALRYAPRVRVNAVAPGPVLPPVGGGHESLAAWKKAVPLQRIGTPDEVADAVLFLLGATDTTGQVLFVDGGRHMGRQAGRPGP